MSIYTEHSWINSKDILNKTGISRATLNNYIKLGIIPKPIVQKPGEGMKGTKKIGYFPYEVLDRINMIKILKKEGNSMEEITHTLKKMPFKGADLEENSSQMSLFHEKGKMSEGNITSEVKDLLLSISGDIRNPAYLINHKFEIEWINTAAEKTIFHQSIDFKNDSIVKNIFSLFCNWTFQSKLKNYKNIIDLHMAFVKSKYPRDFLRTLYGDMTEKELSILQSSYDRIRPVSVDLVSHKRISITKNDGTNDFYRLYTISLKTGILFLYFQTDSLLDGHTNIISDHSNTIADLLRFRNRPTLLPFVVLVAKIQDSERICAELPPEEYFQLINRISVIMDETFLKYYGVRGKYDDTGTMYYFLKNDRSDYLIDALSCAIEIKDKMKKLTAELKAHRKWSNKIFLNIGINEGEEYFGTITKSNGIEYTSIGNTAKYAAKLSELGCFGSLITTKNLMNKIRDVDRKNFTFGVKKSTYDNKCTFAHNIFSRVTDLFDIDEKYLDISELPITEIMEKNL